MARNHRAVVAAVSLMLVLVACSSNGTPEAVDTPSAVAPAPAGSDAPAAPGKGSVKPGGSLVDPTVPSAPGGGKASPLPPVKPATGFKPANLYTAAEDRIGITDDKIVVCIHAALNLAPVFNISQKSLNVYWELVNRQLSGIYGRQVEVTWTDDKYGAQPSDVRAAYEGCKAKNPFMILGGIGFDQIPQVRAWAEEDHQLYIHHIAREDKTKKYSFSYLPTVETVGTRAAQWILHAHKGENVGVIWRNSEHWEPGHKTFKAELARHGVEAVADTPAEKNASLYTTQIRALQNADAEVVFIWENALSAIEIIRQAQDQNYTPTWVVFPFDLMTDTLGEDTVDPIPVEGIAAWMPYLPGVQNAVTKEYQPGKVDGSFAKYKKLIQTFEAHHNEYASGENRDDIVAMTWTGFAQLHKLLLQCGKDCTRNKMVGLLHSGLHTAIAPGCPINFGSNGHVGSDSVMIFKAFRNTDGKYGWKEIERCKTGF